MNNIRQWMLAAILTLFSTTIIAQNGVTFTVDENLAFKDEDFMARLQFSGEEVLEDIFEDEGVPGDTHKWLAWSFADNEKFFCIRGKDVFFQTVVRAYAEHRPLVLSPDMVWVLISQGFARYVNAHAEELRDQFVDHDGKIHLVVKSEKDLLTEETDWAQIMSDFTGQIERNTKGDIGQTITADFSTTGVTERITSQITLMESLKEYFEYVVVYLACGIPTVTLTGTPQDWQKVLEKTRRLAKYGVGKWTQSLEPILKEFVEASKGKANQQFWQGMVKQKRVDKLAGGPCDPAKPTELDGWILKFFPDENGQTLDKVPHTDTMPAERVYVDFIYQMINPLTGIIMLEVPMQLVAGFIGTEVDAQTHALTPKMGWAVRQMASTDSIVKKLKSLDEESFSGINLRVSSVPDFLSELKYIKRLTLHFTNGVVLPDWFYGLKIDKLTIEGDMSDELEAAIKKHFPKAIIKRIKSPLIVSNEPLIIVDGAIFMGKLSDIDPATIKSQRVLKDAVATAVYGSQGANGVIEITTKGFTQQSAEESSKTSIAVKAGDKISGTLSDDMGPLMGATVCEIDASGRIVGSAITDNNGQFTMKVQNPDDSLRFSYVGMKTTKLAIDKTEYKIKLQPVRRLDDLMIKQKRQSGSSTLPIPQREISYKDLDQIMEERGMVKAEDLELEGDPVISNRNNPRGLISLTDEEQALVMSVNDLGFNLIRTISLLNPKSILLSPLGMTYALGQINNGAAGETRKQITNVLGCKDKETAKINNFCRKMLTEAPQLDKTTQLEITNEFISPKSFTPKPAFTRVVKDSYDTQFSESESEPLKFTLKNTIYFKGIWADKFRKVNTKDEVFRCESGIETMVPMMNQFHQFFYTENDLCQALCLPYSNGAYQMIVLLPKEEKTVCDVAGSLTADSWKKMYAQMQRIDVDVKLPRFESESEVNLGGTMTPLMSNAFRMNKADFSNLFDVKSCIDRIKQVGHIKVDETGAEASVITSLQGDLGSVKTVQPETVRFHANHPFLYFIREWSTGAIFFIGQYMGLY